MKQISGFFIIIFLISQAINAQSDFKDGYVITPEQDTIYGLIFNGSYFHNSQICKFMDTLTRTQKVYAPEDLYGYRFIDGKFYISKEVVINFRPEVLFMECLIDGNLDIYFYQDLLGENYYFASKDTLPLQELKYNENLLQVNGTLRIQKSTKYKGILHYYTYDCPELNNDINGLGKPDHDNLIKIASKYHYLTCEEKECTIYEKKIPRKIKMNIAGGASYFYNSELTDESVFSPVFGVEFMFQYAQRRENYYLGVGSYINLIAKNGSVISIPLSVNYLNQQKRFSPYVSYSLDAFTFGALQMLKIGAKYQINNLSLLLSGDIRTYLFYYPVSSSLNLGIMYDLR